MKRPESGERGASGGGGGFGGGIRGDMYVRKNWECCQAIVCDFFGDFIRLPFARGFPSGRWIGGS
jgi:hypothetical protein